MRTIVAAVAILGACFMQEVSGRVLIPKTELKEKKKKETQDLKTFIKAGEKIALKDDAEAEAFDYDHWKSTGQSADLFEGIHSLESTEEEFLQTNTSLHVLQVADQQQSDDAITSPCDETLTGAKGSGYRGCQTLTRSGKTCQKWTSQTPQKHSNTPSKKPGKGLGDHNSCRNPDGEDTIWCYTTDPSKRWQYCDTIQSKATTCVSTEQAKWNTSYCNAWMCTDCCQKFCKNKCTGYATAMAAEGCACATANQVHLGAAGTIPTHCATKAAALKTAQNDLTWETQMGLACAKGCKQCCATPAATPAATFLQGVDVQKELEDAERMQQCSMCMLEEGHAQ